MTIPFLRQTFQQVMKPMVSMAHLSLEYENIESSIVKVCAELSDKLSAAAYEQIIVLAGGASSSDDDVSTIDAALEYLQRSILHFALYHHVIYTIANITNDGITVTKSDDKTTIYKYQQDRLEEQLLSDAWFWLNRLIRLLNEHQDIFTAWADSDERELLNDLPVSISAFERYVGVSDPTFMLYAGWIIREVWHEEVESRLEGVGDIFDHLQSSVERAVCYEVMARACSRLAFHALPSPIRIDINNEMGKNHAAQADTTIREKVAQLFADKALGYWKGLDAELRTIASEEAADYGNARPLKESQRFVV